MYEIDGIKFTKEELEAEAKKRGITFDEFLNANINSIKIDGQTKSQSEQSGPVLVPEGKEIVVEEDDTNPIFDQRKSNLGIPTFGGESTKATNVIDANLTTAGFELPDAPDQNLNEPEQEEQDKELKLKSYKQAIEDYDAEVQRIVQDNQVDPNTRLKLINELPIPEFGVSSDVQDVIIPNEIKGEGQDLLSEDQTIGDKGNEYLYNKDLSTLIQKTIKDDNFELEGEEYEQGVDNSYKKIFSETINKDPLVKSRREFYQQNLMPKAKAYAEELKNKGIYDTTTQAGMDLLMGKVDTYYASLLDESMASDPVVNNQMNKLSTLFGRLNSKRDREIARAKDPLFAKSDILQNLANNHLPHFGETSFVADIIAGVEQATVATEALGYNTWNTIGAQVDGKRKGDAKKILEKLDALQQEGKGDEDSVSLRIGEYNSNTPNDNRPLLEGTIKELRNQAEQTLATSSKSLEENIKQLTEFEEYRSLAEQAKFSDGVSFRDLMLGLGSSAPTMGAITIGTAISTVAPEVGLPLLGILANVTGQGVVTAQFYAENYMDGIKAEINNNPEMYPGGDTKENIDKAIVDGGFDDVAQDFAAAAFMAQLEKLGTGASIKALYKTMGVSPLQGIKSLFRGEIKGVLNNIKKGAIIGTENGFVESMTETGQAITSQINTGIKQGDTFKYLDGEETFESAIAGFSIGAFLPSASGIATQTRTEIRTAAMKFAKEFNPKSDLARTEAFFKRYAEGVRQKYSDANGNIINQKEFDEVMDDISSIRNSGLSVPGDFSKNARGEALGLLTEKRKVQRDLDSYPDKTLAKNKLKRIKEIDIRLGNIAKAEDQITKAKKISKQLSDDVIDEFKTFENEKEVREFLEENGKDPDLADGRGLSVNIDGKEIALVNTEKMTDGVGYFTGAHEILHKFLKNTLRTNPEAVYAMANVIKDRLKVLSENPSVQDNEKIRALNKVLNEYKRDGRVSEAKEAEEMITLFSEFVDLGLIAKDKKLGDNLLSSSRRFLQKVPGMGKIKFNNANDILNFIADYNKSINKGRLTRAQRNAAEQGIEISDDLTAAGLEFDKERVVSKESASKDASLAKDIEIQNIIDKQDTSQPRTRGDLAYKFYDDVLNYIRSGRFKIGQSEVRENPKISGTFDQEDGVRVEGGVTVEDLASDIVLGMGSTRKKGGGVLGLVNEYFDDMPASYRKRVTLGQFIGASKDFDLYRATEVAAKTLQMQSEFKEETPKKDFSKEEKQSLRQSFVNLGDDLGLEEGGDFYNNVIEKTKRTLGTRLGDVSSGKFLKALRNAGIADLETDIKSLMGTPTSTKYRNFIQTYATAILNKAQQTTLNKRLGKLTEPVIDPKTGKQARTLTDESRAEGSRVKDPYAGNPKRKLIPGLTPKDLTDFFVDTERPDSKRNSLAKIAAIEFTEDALRQALATQVEDKLGRKPGDKGYEPTTLEDERAEKFGRDKVEAEIAFIARELGRGEGYSFAKDIVIEPDMLSEFMTNAYSLLDIAYTTGYKDEDGNYKPEFQQAIEGLDDNVVKAIDMLLEEDPTLEQGGEFVKVNKKFLEQENENLLKQVNNKDHIITSKNKGVRTINKPAAESMNNFAQIIVKKIDSGLINAFNSSLEFLGFSNRLLDPAKQKENGKPGEYYEDFLIAKSAKTKKTNNVKANNVIPMNKDFTKVKQILTPLLRGGNIANKLSLLQNSEQKIKDANVANIELFKNLMLEIQKEYQNGKKITPLQLFQFFQLQTSAVKGLRALSGFDYLYLIDGNQDIESFKKKRLSKDNFLKLDTEQQDASIQEFIDEFPEFKARYDLRLQQNLDKGMSLPEAKVQAAFGTKPSAYVDLVTKGEHLVPNSITMTELFQGMLKGNLTDASLDKILSGHTQFFGPNYVMDLIDAKGIEGGPKIALTSQEGILRITKFLKNQTSISNNIYSIDGQKAYNKIFEQEVLDKKIKVLDESASQAKDIDIDNLKSSGVLNLDDNMSMEDVLSKAVKIDKALKIARDPNAPVKKIRVFDFDDTLATSNNIVIATSPDGTVRELNAEEFATEGFDLKSQGYELDFSDFNNVTDGGRGPLFKIAKKIRDSRGNEDLFVLTARAPEAAPAIYEFLKSQGLEIPLENITGLGNSTGEAKANWIIDKAADGYNDFYFADDAIQNVSAVASALNVVDVKSKVQQAKASQAKDLDLDFNDIIEQKTGIGSLKEYSKAKAQVRGAKRNKFQFFIPYSAEDFVGLIYPLLSKGERGDKQLAWFKENLFDPFARAQLNLQQARVNLMQDFKKLKEDLNVPKDLVKESVDGFTNEEAVRVYLWNKQGLEIPGLSKSDTKELVSVVENNPTLKTFADKLLQINKSPYPAPLKDWLTGSITTDLMRGLKETKRPEYLQQWQENVDTIFSEKNLNKLEAAYGARYREAIENILARMKSGSNRLQEGNRLSNKILNFINGSNAAIMFFNTRSAILQTISSINFLNWGFNNPVKAGAAFANQPQYWKDFMKLMNSDFLKDRRNGLRINITESEIADAAKTSKNKAKAVLNYILAKGYAPTQYADSFAIATGGATFYRNRINDLIKNENMSESDAEAKAMEEFMEITEENQQSSRPDKISQQQSSDYGRLILMFANTPMQYARLQKRAIQDLTAGRGDTKTNVSKIIYYGVVQNIIFNALQQAVFGLGFGDEEEDDKQKTKRALGVANGMADSLLRGLGVGGAAVSVIKNFLADIYDRSGRSKPDYVDSIYKLLQFSPPIGSKISRLRAAAWQFDSKKRRQEMFDKGFSLDNPAYLAGAKVVSATTNVPLDRILLKLDNLSGIMDEDTETWQKFALAAGWPKWQLNPPKIYGSPEEKFNKQPPKLDRNSSSRKVGKRKFKSKLKR